MARGELIKYWRHYLSSFFKKKRINYMNKHLLGGKLFDESWLQGKKIMELGCGRGLDFIAHFTNHPNAKIVGVDVLDYSDSVKYFEFVRTDAECLPFPDKYFDLTVSFGVLEHIEPIEKLCRVVSEIARVSQSYIVLVPSIATLLEPHTASFFWQLRDGSKKIKNFLPFGLNYFSDEAWLNFKGFQGAKIRRFSYIPILIKNQFIYKIAQ